MNSVCDPKVRHSVDKDSNPKNCWDFINCSSEFRNDCPAYLADRGKDCWMLASHFCPRVVVNVEACWDCPWFRKVKGI